MPSKFQPPPIEGGGRGSQGWFALMRQFTATGNVEPPPTKSEGSPPSEGGLCAGRSRAASMRQAAATCDFLYSSVGGDAPPS